jgi:LmbE family N-acetylglucosaminyl deacetylase
MWGSDEPDEFMDISDVLETKVKSMLCHSSQFLERPSRDRTREPGQFMMEGAKRMGERAGVPYAEGFRKLEFRT